MNKFYQRVIKEAEEKLARDKEKQKPLSPLLEIKDERVIPKLRFKKRKGGRRNGR